MTSEFRLTVRGPDWSVSELVEPPLARRAFLTDRRVKTILIHGFANSSDKAQRSYARFVNHLQGILYPIKVPSATSVWEFDWPGDHPWKPLNVFTYSSRVEAADSAGRSLAELLSRLDKRATVVLVAHSMGCRVALSAIRQLQSFDVNRDPGTGPTELHGPRVLTVLMAAAVPVSSCRLSDQPDPLPGETVEEAWRRILAKSKFGWKRPLTKYVVLYSDRDTVLKYGFPAGQLGHSRFAQAVGLRGGPEQPVAGVHRWDTRIPTGLGHGGYWKSRYVASKVIEHVRPGWRRYMASWNAEPESLDLASRELVPGRQLPVNEIRAS